MSRISLDTYNQDILYEIVSVAGIANLTKLLDSTFLQYNSNIQQAINNVINKKSIHKYENATTPFKSAIYSTVSDWRTTDFNTIAEAQVFDDYCVGNDIAIELEFSYLMRTILDWIEMEKLLKGLKPGKVVKRNLKIDLMESDYTLDLTKLPSLIGPIKERFVGLSIDSSPVGSSVGAIDLEYLRDIEALHLKGCGINGSFFQCHHLRELDYMPPRTQNSIDLQKLPPTLKRLHLYSCERIEGFADKSTRFPSLESMAVSFMDSELPLWVKDVLRLMTCNKTASIEYKGDEDSADDDFLEILFEEARIKGFKLNSLKLDTNSQSKLQLLPSRNLDQTGMKNEHWHPSELPSTLQEMRLDSFELSSGKQVLQYFPSSLVKLELIDGGYIDWSDSDLDFSKFSNMKTLTLDGCGIGNNIDGFTFPDSLEELNLSHSYIRYVGDIKFPKKLKKLAFAWGAIEEICEASFPQSLKELDLSKNILKDVDVDLSFNKFGEPLQINLLDLRGNCVVLSKCKLPATVRYLALDCIQDEAFHFGDNLRVLNLSGSKFQKPHEVTFGSSLTSLDLSWCDLKPFSMKLPDSLEEIDLSGNALNEVPVQLCNLRKLKTINISDNKIKSVKLNFTSSSLEVLNISCNKIKEIQLTFPETVTNLKSVDLSENRLKSFSMASIGHNSKTLHNNLYELVLWENHQLLKKDISTLLSRLPESTQLVWGNNERYNTSYIYVANELPNKYLAQRQKHSGIIDDSYLDTDSESGSDCT